MILNFAPIGLGDGLVEGIGVADLERYPGSGGGNAFVTGCSELARLTAVERSTALVSVTFSER